MTRRAGTIVLTLLAAGLLVTTIRPRPAPHYVWNLSPSVPLGLYSIEPAAHLDVTDLVVAWPPEPLATELADAGYLPRGVPLIKRVRGLPSHTVCRAGPLVTVDGIATAPARERDRIGRLLPAWQGCRVIGPDEIFLMNWDDPDSLDGRYFGPLPRTSIMGRAVPLWTDEHGDGRFHWRALAPRRFRQQQQRRASWHRSAASPAPSTDSWDGSARSRSMPLSH